jgi:hypothetical protein
MLLFYLLKDKQLKVSPGAMTLEEREAAAVRCGYLDGTLDISEVETGPANEDMELDKLKSWEDDTDMLLAGPTPRSPDVVDHQVFEEEVPPPPLAKRRGRPAKRVVGNIDDEFKLWAAQPDDIGLIDA